jgi:hypothetical protein
VEVNLRSAVEAEFTMTILQNADGSPTGNSAAV